MGLWGLAIPAAVLAAAWIAARGWRSVGRARWLPVVGSLAWIAYWYWESQVVEPGDNIRADLVLFYPLLFALTIAALLALADTLD